MSTEGAVVVLQSGKTAVDASGRTLVFGSSGGCPECCGDEATGACCVSGSCQSDLTPDECAALSGQYLGDGTNCAGETCGTGACCLPGGACLDGETVNSCAARGGVFEGSGSQCSGVICSDPSTDCCSGQSSGPFCVNADPDDGPATIHYSIGVSVIENRTETIGPSAGQPCTIRYSANTSFSGSALDDCDANHNDCVDMDLDSDGCDSFNPDLLEVCFRVQQFSGNLTKFSWHVREVAGPPIVGVEQTIGGCSPFASVQGSDSVVVDPNKSYDVSGTVQYAIHTPTPCPGIAGGTLGVGGGIQPERSVSPPDRSIEPSREMRSGIRPERSLMHAA